MFTRSIDRLQLSAFAFLALITIISVLAALQTGESYIALLPLGLMVVYATLINFKLMYFVMLAAIPLSLEYSFSSSLATDLPDEPLMIGLTLITFAYLIKNPRALPTGFFTNIIIVALLVHIFWILLSGINSVNIPVSIKIFAAKIWYVTAFTVVTAIVVRTEQDIKRMFWCLFIPLTFAMLTVLVRYAALHFEFDEVNKPMSPFFRNHVNYAAILSVFFPFLFLARTWYKKGSFKRVLLNFSILLYLVAIYFSYTRTCYIAIVLLVPVYFAIKYRLMRFAVPLLFIGGALMVNHLLNENRYLKYAPNYTETIYHDDFNEHLASTFEGKDVSSMERVYRWVAAVHMFADHPYMGFGPGNFYPYYKDYAVANFRTYVSDNPERSTTHNYLLLMATEQGGIGLAIFLLLTAVIFIYGEALYYRLEGVSEKRLTLTLLLIFAMVYFNLMLSDLLESDKVGPFFFIGIGLLAAIDIAYRRRKKGLPTPYSY